MNIINIYEEALENCGISPTSITSVHLDSVRRTWKLMLLSHQSMYQPLFALGNREVPLSIGDSSFLLQNNEIDITEASLRDSAGNERPVRNISYVEWIDIPHKTIAGIPSLIYVDREYTPGNQANVYLWQTVSIAGQTLVLKTLEYIDSSGGWGDDPKVPPYWYNPLVWDLAERLAYKWAPDRVSLLKDKRKEEVRGSRISDAPQGEIRFSLSRRRRGIR